MEDDAGQWVTVQEASRLLNRSERTVHRMAADGRLSARKESGRLFVNVADAEIETTDKESDVSEAMSLRLELAEARGEVGKLSAIVNQLTDERDNLRGDIKFYQSEVAALTQVTQRLALEPPKRRRSWWPPWGRGDT